MTTYQLPRYQLPAETAALATVYVLEALADAREVQNAQAR